MGCSEVEARGRERSQCHTEYAETWIQEIILRSEPETLD